MPMSWEKFVDWYIRWIALGLTFAGAWIVDWYPQTAIPIMIFVCIVVIVDVCFWWKWKEKMGKS